MNVNLRAVLIGYESAPTRLKLYIQRTWYLQSATQERNNPHRHSDVDAHSSLGCGEFIKIHRSRILLEPLLLLLQPFLKVLIPRHDKRIDLQIQRVTTFGIVGRPDQCDAGTSLFRHRHPQTLSVVRPSVFLANSSAAPFF